MSSFASGLAKAFEGGFGEQAKDICKDLPERCTQNEIWKMIKIVLQAHELVLQLEPAILSCLPCAQPQHDPWTAK